MKHFEPKQFRQNFPLIRQYSQLNTSTDNPTSVVYFDNGATTQKPDSVIACYQHFYQNLNANVHRASHHLSTQATNAFEQARSTVKTFINANSDKEIVWTKGTTESINLLASSLGKQVLNTGDEIILAVSEHHANIVPWQLIAEETGALIKVLSLDVAGRVDLNELDQLLTKQTKIVCCAHVSNVLGKINPIVDVINKAKKVGAITVIDGAQAIAHFPIDVQALDCDFYVFSAHKMYGSTGVGVLYGKESLLDAMPPYQAGGEMIKTVSLHKKTTFNVLPFKFEAGTPNIAGIIAFAEAIHFIKQFNHAEITAYEKKLTQYCYQELSKFSTVKFITEQAPDIPVIAFTVIGNHNHDIATSLDSYGIAIRSGHHCAMPLMEYLTISGCLRVSMAAYNTFDEIDFFISTLTKILQQEKESSVAVIQDNRQSSNLQNININIDTDSTAVTDSLIDKFSKLKGWDSRHREIMLLSKELKRMDKAFRNDDNLINGCESLAWLAVTQDSKGIFNFDADSDARIIRGLLVIVLSAFNHKSAIQIKAFDINAYFDKLGLMQHLSPSRGNGVLAIVDKIKAFAK